MNVDLESALNLEEIAAEVFGPQSQPVLLDAPRKLGRNRVVYELQIMCDDDSCVEVAMETSTGVLQNSDRAAVLDFMKLLQNHLQTA